MEAVAPHFLGPNLDVEGFKESERKRNKSIFLSKRSQKNTQQNFGSFVWNYFTFNKSGNTSLCKICPTFLPSVKRQVLENHIREKHPSVVLKFQTKVVVPIEMRATRTPEHHYQSSVSKEPYSAQQKFSVKEMYQRLVDRIFMKKHFLFGRFSAGCTQKVREYEWQQIFEYCKTLGYKIPDGSDYKIIRDTIWPKIIRQSLSKLEKSSSEDKGAGFTPTDKTVFELLQTYSSSLLSDELVAKQVPLPAKSNKKSRSGKLPSPAKPNNKSLSVQISKYVDKMEKVLQGVDDDDDMDDDMQSETELATTLITDYDVQGHDASAIGGLTPGEILLRDAEVETSTLLETEKRAKMLDNTQRQNGNDSFASMVVDDEERNLPSGVNASSSFWYRNKTVDELDRTRKLLENEQIRLNNYKLRLEIYETETKLGLPHKVFQ